jgi:hypothetical protein
MTSPGNPPLMKVRKRGPATAAMYVIDARHYLDDKGDIAPERGPARKMADFVTSVIAHASDFDRPGGTPGPVCFRCHKRDNRRVDTGMAEDDAVVWHCEACGTAGRISNWQGTFWDLGRSAPSD